ncbi:MAG: PAS domain S-box protein [Candidatus Pristimantibacillus sp.]
MIRRNEAIMNNSFMNSIWEHTTDGMVVVDLAGRVMDVNPAFVKLYGWTKEEALGQVLPVTPPHLCTEAKQLDEKVFAGEMVSGYETYKMRKDGTMFYASVTISALRDHDGTIIGLVSIERDITDRLKIENSLLEAEKRYSLLAESVLAGVFVGQGQDIVYVNSYLASLFGYTIEEFSQMNILEVMDKADVQYHLNDVLEKLFIQKLPQYKYTFKGIKKDKSIVYLEGNSCVITYKGKPAVLGTVQDITMKLQLEQSLRDHAKMYQKVIKFLPEAIVLSDNGVVIYANKSAVKLINANDEGELNGRNIFDFIHADYRTQVMNISQTIMKLDNPTEFVEIKLIGSDGQPINAECSSIAIYNYLGRMVELTVIRDLTERKLAEDLLVRSEKLSVIGQLAAGVAHEIRNPLTALKGFTQLLKSRNEGNGYYYDIMTNELERINIIVNEFMTLAKPHLSQFREGKLEEILAGVISILQTQAIMMNVTIEIEYEKEIPTLLCDDNQLKQVFINIIKNAIEAMPHGGRVTINANSDSQGQVHLIIRDEGIGISNKVIHQIGQPFITTKEKGTGLGLMICSRIIEEHNGQLHISSKEGEGTTVEIIIPSNSL